MIFQKFNFECVSTFIRFFHVGLKKGKGHLGKVSFSLSNLFSSKRILPFPAPLLKRIDERGVGFVVVYHKAVGIIDNIATKERGIIGRVLNIVRGH